ncbi:hypothetical protein P3L10_027513 [Capsicum annuum]|nr:uncharacterized protein LOC107845445 [Capsicum annuum]
MIYLRKFNSWRFLTIQESSTTCFLNSKTQYQFSQFSSSFWRPFSFSPQFHQEADEMRARCTKVSAVCGVQGRAGLRGSIGLFSRLESVISWSYDRRSFINYSEAPLQELDKRAARCTEVSFLCGVQGRAPEGLIGLFGRRNFTSNSEALLQESDKRAARCTAPAMRGVHERNFTSHSEPLQESDKREARCSFTCGVHERVEPQVSIGLFGRRSFTSNSEALLQESDSVAKKVAKKPLGVFFQEAVGLLEKSEQSESEDETENKEVKCKLRKLEEEVRILREKRKNEKSRNGNGVLGNEGKSKKLHELFMNEEGKSVKSRKSRPLSMEDHTVYKELSPDLVMFVTHLYKEGYFKDSNFLPRKRFDITCFENSYARDFVKCAAEQFGRDHQEIAKWLSGSDLKKVAVFGCPSIAKKTVFSAKRLRSYFRIQEDNVCSKCTLKASCKFVNQNVPKSDMTNLHLVVVMRVITLYALESVPPQLVVPDEIKASVSRLLMDILRLSRTVS